MEIKAVSCAALLVLSSSALAQTAEAPQADKAPTPTVESAPSETPAKESKAGKKHGKQKAKTRDHSDAQDDSSTSPNTPVRNAGSKGRSRGQQPQNIEVDPD